MEILAIMAIALGGYISLANWVMLYRSIKTKKFHSAIPLFGALFLGLGSAFFEATRRYAFLSIFVDWGTIVVFASLPNLIISEWKTSRFNLVKKFKGQIENANYELSLYKLGDFVIRTSYDPCKDCGNDVKLISSGRAGKWQEEDSVIILHENYGRIFRLVFDGIVYKLEEPDFHGYEEDKFECFDGVELTLQYEKQS